MCFVFSQEFGSQFLFHIGDYVAQSIKKLVSEIDKNAAKKDDSLGLRLLKVKDLRMELEERGITWKGLLKPQLVATLTASIQREHEVGVEQEDGAAEDGAVLENVSEENL